MLTGNNASALQNTPVVRRSHSIDCASVDANNNQETRVYVGVDVFGRNFYEGGGFNCNKVCL